MDDAVELLARHLSGERNWNWDHVSHEADRQMWRQDARDFLVRELLPLLAAAARDERRAIRRRIAERTTADPWWLCPNDQPKEH